MKKGKRLPPERLAAAGLLFPPCAGKTGVAVWRAGIPVTGRHSECSGGFPRACRGRCKSVPEAVNERRFRQATLSAGSVFSTRLLGHAGRGVCRVRKTLRDSRVPGTACRLANGLPGLFHRFHRQSFRFQEIRSRLPFPASRQKREADPGSRLSRNSAAVSSRQPGLFTQMVSCPDCRAARSRESGQAKHRSRGR